MSDKKKPPKAPSDEERFLKAITKAGIKGTGQLTTRISKYATVIKTIFKQIKKGGAVEANFDAVRGKGKKGDGFAFDETNRLLHNNRDFFLRVNAVFTGGTNHLATAAVGMCVISSPPRRMVPELAWRRPQMVSNTLVLPQPLGLMRATH